MLSCSQQVILNDIYGRIFKLQEDDMIKSKYSFKQSAQDYPFSIMLHFKIRQLCISSFLGRIRNSLTVILKIVINKPKIECFCLICQIVQFLFSGTLYRKVVSKIVQSNNFINSAKLFFFSFRYPSKFQREKASHPSFLKITLLQQGSIKPFRQQSKYYKDSMSYFDHQTNRTANDPQECSAVSDCSMNLKEDKQQPPGSNCQNRKAILIVLLLLGMLTLSVLKILDYKWQEVMAQQQAEFQRAMRMNRAEMEKKLWQEQAERMAVEMLVNKKSIKNKEPVISKDTKTIDIVNARNNFQNTPKPPTTIKGKPGDPAYIYNSRVIKVIDTPYPENGKGKEEEYLPLPIDFLRRNVDNKTIADVLYPFGYLREERKQFQDRRIAFANLKAHVPQAALLKYNNVLDPTADEQGKRANEREWARLNRTLGIGPVEGEVPMCVVVTRYSQSGNFGIEYNLNSVFAQNYSNYKVVIVNDQAGDGRGMVYRNYFAFHRIDRAKYAYVEGGNHYFAALSHCGKDSIVVLMDAGDEFVGRNVLSVLNWAYQKKRAGVVYSNFFRQSREGELSRGVSGDYTQDEKRRSLFRSVPAKFGRLLSFRNELLFSVRPQDLRDTMGLYFTKDFDAPLMIPLMEVACGRVFKVEGEVQYLENEDSGHNAIDLSRPVGEPAKIAKHKKYPCNQEFDKRMRGE